MPRSPVFEPLQESRMVLASQMNRPGSMRGVPGRGRPRWPRRVVTLLILAGVGGGAWYWQSVRSANRPSVVHAPGRGGEDESAAPSGPHPTVSTSALETEGRTPVTAGLEPVGGVLTIDGKSATPGPPPAGLTPGRSVMTGKAGGLTSVSGAAPTPNAVDSGSSRDHAGNSGSGPSAGAPPVASPPDMPGKAPANSSPTAATERGPTAAHHPALAQGMKLIEEGRYAEGRLALSRLLLAADDSLSEEDAQSIRTTLASVNKELIFSRDVTAQDPLVETYTIQSGDMFARLAPRYKLPAEALEAINGIDGRRLQVGQKVKLVRGPFHVRVVKRAFRMDLLLHTPEGEPVYIRSFPVGLGEKDSTPLGQFIVKQGGKVANPAWSNPRTGEHFKADDPKNPIGDYWLALEGADEHTKDKKGYGIHGTIEPESIGRMMSMGCVRLRDADIALVFKLLTDGQTTVRVEP